MLICNCKGFTSLPENRNATVEPDAAGLLLLHTSYEDTIYSLKTRAPCATTASHPRGQTSHKR